MKLRYGLRGEQACSGRAAQPQDGLTLVEFMVSIALGMLVLLATTALLLSTKSAYTFQDEGVRLQDAGRYALESIVRATRQAAYENWDSDEAPLVTAESAGANIFGVDASSLKGGTEALGASLAASVNGSDVLVIRFFGAGRGEHGDGSIVNCAGFGIPALTSQAAADRERGSSIFYVAKAATGEPGLYCKYRGKKEWESQAIVYGVESFQALYGLDTDADGVPNQILNATAINALDEMLVSDDGPAAMQTLEKSRKSHWKKVVMVKIALLVRGTQNARMENSAVEAVEYDLFGKVYADAYASTDTGVRIREAALPKSEQKLLRKVFSTTIQLRNQAGENAV